MKLLKMEKVRDGFLKNYVLTYENKAGREKKFEIVSHRDLNGPEELGQKVSGVSIVAEHEGKLLLLREFRMGVNRYIYNLCAGMVEPGETMEQCIARELYEETGLSVKRIRKILRPSFAAVALSDIRNQIAYIDAEGEFSDHSSENESIKASFYTPAEVEKLLETEDFSSRAQAVAYAFTEKYSNNSN